MATTHQLYVYVGGGAPAEKEKNAKLTRAMLVYIKKNIGVLKQMGATIRVTKLTDTALANPKVVKALRKQLGRSDQSVTFPALLIDGRPFFGLEDIVGVCERNKQAFAASQRKGSGLAKGAADDDLLDAYYRDEMTEDKAKNDKEDDDVTEGLDLMDAYRRRMESRAGRPEPKKSAASPKKSNKKKKAPRPAAPKTAPRRPNNLKPTDNPVDSLNAIGPSTGADGEVDDYMMRSFLENMEESM